MFGLGFDSKVQTKLNRESVHRIFVVVVGTLVSVILIFDLNWIRVLKFFYGNVVLFGIVRRLKTMVFFFTSI